MKTSLREQIREALYKVNHRGLIEIAPELGYQLRTECMTDWEPPQTSDGDWRFRGVPLKMRRHLKGWRVTGEKFEGVWPPYLVDFGDEEPPNPLALTSADFDEKAALEYEQAREKHRQAYHRARVIHSRNPLR